MNDLQEKNKITTLAFENKMFGLSPKHSSLINNNYQVALSFMDDESNIKKQTSILKEGTEIFEKLFGFKSQYFTAPNATIRYIYFQNLSEFGIKLVDVARINNEPIGIDKYKKHFHYLGQKNKFNQKYLVRNCVFEPTNSKIDVVSKCMNMISLAFSSKQPAIISSHRVNFSGYLYPKNRDLGLKELSILLDRILKKWPDAEFISIRELNNLMEKN